jgi:hypothetical protein
MDEMMPGKHLPIPSDQFQKATDELRKLNLIVEEVQRSLDMAENINTFEASRSLEKASDHLETAGYWLNKVVKALIRASSGATHKGTYERGHGGHSD